jgi:hypothetical protein
MNKLGAGLSLWAPAILRVAVTGWLDRLGQLRHCTAAGEVSRSRCIDGRVTATMLTSSRIMKPPTRVTQSARHRFGSRAGDCGTRGTPPIGLVVEPA